MPTATKEQSYTMTEIKRANKAAGGHFFDKSHLDHLKRWGGHMSLRNNVITTVLPNGDEGGEGARSYQYKFIPETGAMRPIIDGEVI